MDETGRTSRFFSVTAPTENWIPLAACSFNKLVRTFFPLWFHLFVYDSSTICFISSYNKKKKKTKNINTSSLSSYCLENRLYNYNSTRFRYMTKKKKDKRKRNEEQKTKERKKMKHTLLLSFAVSQDTRVLNQAIVARSHRYFCFNLCP